jgi:hypothetical protein
LTRLDDHSTAVAVDGLESLAASDFDGFGITPGSTRCRPGTRHGRSHFCVATILECFVTTLDALIEQVLRNGARLGNRVAQGITIRSAAEVAATR